MKQILFQLRLNDSTELNSYVESYEKEVPICTGIGTLSVVFSPNLPVTLNPGSRLVLYEYNHSTASYFKDKEYFVGDRRKDSKTGSITVECKDGAKYLEDYFIPHPMETTRGHRAKYWIERVLQEVGLGLVWLPNHSGIDMDAVITLGMQSAYDALVTLCQQNGWYFYMNANNQIVVGAVEFSPSNFSVSLDEDNILSLEVHHNDDMLRNRGVVWGGTDWNTRKEIFVDRVRTTPWDRDNNDRRAVVISNGAIGSQDVAEAMSKQILDEFARITVTKTVEVEGYLPVTVLPGMGVRVSHPLWSGVGMITTLNTSMTKQGGFRRTIVLDERCPRLFAYFKTWDFPLLFPDIPEVPIMNPIEPVFIGTAGQGVWYKAIDNSIGWTEYNEGLPLNANIGDLYVHAGVAVCIAGGQAYTRMVGDEEWSLFRPTGFVDVSDFIQTLDPEDLHRYNSNQLNAVGCCINQATGEIYVAYNLTNRARSWVCILQPTTNQFVTRQVYTPHPEDPTLEFGYRIRDIESTMADMFLLADRGDLGEITIDIGGGTFNEVNSGVSQNLIGTPTLLDTVDQYVGVGGLAFERQSDGEWLYGDYFGGLGGAFNTMDGSYWYSGPVSWADMVWNRKLTNGRHTGYTLADGTLQIYLVDYKTLGGELIASIPEVYELAHGPIPILGDDGVVRITWLTGHVITYEGPPGTRFDNWIYNTETRELRVIPNVYPDSVSSGGGIFFFLSPQGLYSVRTNRGVEGFRGTGDVSGNFHNFHYMFNELGEFSYTRFAETEESMFPDTSLFGDSPVIYDEETTSLYGFYPGTFPEDPLIGWYIFPLDPPQMPEPFESEIPVAPNAFALAYSKTALVITEGTGGDGLIWKVNDGSVFRDFSGVEPVYDNNYRQIIVSVDEAQNDRVYVIDHDLDALGGPAEITIHWIDADEQYGSRVATLRPPIEPITTKLIGVGTGAMQPDPDVYYDKMILRASPEDNFEIVFTADKENNLDNLHRMESSRGNPINLYGSRHMTDEFGAKVVDEDSGLLYSRDLSINDDWWYSAVSEYELGIIDDVRHYDTTLPVIGTRRFMLVTQRDGRLMYRPSDNLSGEFSELANFEAPLVAIETNNFSVQPHYFAATWDGSESKFYQRLNNALTFSEFSTDLPQSRINIIRVDDIL